MPTTTEDQPLITEQDLVMARQRVRRATVELGFGIVDQTKMVTAASELARNTIVYGGGGFMRVEIIAEGGRKGLRLHFVDQGPGIADVGRALTDGWTSGKGMGLGLSGAKRLVNDFEIETAPGLGTRVTIARWR